MSQKNAFIKVQQPTERKEWVQGLSPEVHQSPEDMDLIASIPPMLIHWVGL